MSVINQMLQGLDKGTQQQQADVESSGAVIVAAPKSQNKLVIVLISSIVIFAALAGYLFVQKQSRAAKVSVQQNIVVPVVSRDNNTQVNGPLIAKIISAELVEQPVVIKLDDDKVTMAEPRVMKPIVAKPVMTKQVVAQLAVAPVTETSAAVVSSTNKVAGSAATKMTHVKNVVVARVEKVTPKTITPVAVTAPQTVAKHVKATTPESEHVEDSVLIKAVTRTPLQQAQLYATQADSALLAGDKERAKQLFSKVLAFDKQHNLSRETLAAILYGEQRTQSAVNLLQEGLSVSPDYTNFRLMLARIYLKNKNKQQAYYYLKPHRPEVAGNVDYYALLAGLAQSLDDLDSALMAYKTLTEHEPNRAKWWLGLGISADKAKQVTLALNAYHTAQNMGQLSASSRNYINARIIQLEKQ
ncbi:MSHA biogenesis protein MshN [Moritella sp. PE36]|uniref:tetratricopeptide repeat protein n=1 Tax=Moritella sp. PE36 TaxID=58051 RepID=UPI0001569155|nr:tetratricopeptide repeat protein [Moritella sp. PE36]EDM65916.1 MSHA biogenesis protein MshN [Moritella sp. PE36]